MYCSNKLTAVILLLLTIAMVLPVSGSIYDQIVRLDLTYPNSPGKFGFGFVLCEKNDSLFIISASDLLFSPKEESFNQIVISFRNGYSTNQCRIYGWNDKYKFVVFGIVKPAHYHWDTRYGSTQVKSGDLVLLPGRYGQLTETSMEYTGEISLDESRFLNIVSSGTRPGRIGVPVIYDGKIAGMVNNDQGYQLTATSISIIQWAAYKWLSINPKRDVLSLPYLITGFRSGLNMPISTIGNVLVAGELGLFFETSVMSTISLRFGYSRNYFRSRRFLTFDDEFEFVNDYDYYSVAVLYQESQTYARRSFSRAYFEYAYINQDARVLSGGEWHSMWTLPEHADDYEASTHAFSIGGITSRLIYKNIFLGVEVGFQYTLSPYLYINPLRPLERQESNDWLMFVKLNIGLALEISKEGKHYLDY
jgi:hypothetical protein